MSHWQEWYTILHVNTIYEASRNFNDKVQYEIKNIGKKILATFL